MTSPKNYNLPDEIAQTQQARLTEWTWDGATVVELTGTVAELFPQVPVFSRHPFRIGSEENRFKDEIRREPLENQRRTGARSYGIEDLLPDTA